MEGGADFCLINCWLERMTMCFAMSMQQKLGGETQCKKVLHIPKERANSPVQSGENGVDMKEGVSSTVLVES